jgi:hypothetical protein
LISSKWAQAIWRGEAREQMKGMRRGEGTKKEVRIAKDRPKGRVRWKAEQSARVEETGQRIQKDPTMAKVAYRASHSSGNDTTGDRNNPGRPA